MSEPIKIEAEIDIEGLKETIENAKDLNDNKELFDRLVEVARIKKIANDILDQTASIEGQVKGLINSKATALYGNEWEAIKGDNYKITRSGTGAVFKIIGKVQNKFKVVKESLDTEAVTDYIRKSGKLPTGVDYNPTRGSSIRITVQDNV
jgi:hypothetical protein